MEEKFKFFNLKLLLRNTRRRNFSKILIIVETKLHFIEFKNSPNLSKNSFFLKICSEFSFFFFLLLLVINILNFKFFQFQH